MIVCRFELNYMIVCFDQVVKYPIRNIPDFPECYVNTKIVNFKNFSCVVP
jgi:hypothetical protein